LELIAYHTGLGGCLVNQSMVHRKKKPPEELRHSKNNILGQK